MSICFGAEPCRAQSSSPKAVLLFPLEGDKDLARDAGRLFKSVLRQGNTVMVLDYRSDLPTIKRSLAEGRISRADLNSSAPAARQKIAKALDCDYFVTGDAVEEKGELVLSISTFSARTGRQHDFVARAQHNKPADNKENLLLTTVNTVATQFMTQILEVVPPATPILAEGISSGSQAAEKEDAAKTPEIMPAEEESKETPIKTQPETPPKEPDNTTVTQIPPPAPDSSGADAAVYVALADAKRSEGDLASAIDYMRQAINLSTGDASLRIKLAELYTQRGMTTEAAAELQKAMSMTPPEDGKSKLAIARQLESAGSLDQAKKMYEEALAEQPGDVSARLALGDLLWNLGKPDEAAQQYGKAAEIDPTSVKPHERMARLYATRGNFLESMASVNKMKALQKQKPDHPLELSLYRSLMQSADVAYQRYKGQIDQQEEEFGKKNLTREDYYKKARSILTDVEGLAEFLSDTVPPADFRVSHIHRELAASLLGQSVTTLMDWLIKGGTPLKNDYEKLKKESEREMLSAVALERRLRG